MQQCRNMHVILLRVASQPDTQRILDTRGHKLSNPTDRSNQSDHFLKEERGPIETWPSTHARKHIIIRLAGRKRKKVEEKMAGETDWGRATAGDANKAKAAAAGRGLLNNPTALAAGAVLLLAAGGYYMYYGDRRNRGRDTPRVVGDGDH